MPTKPQNSYPSRGVAFSIARGRENFLAILSATVPGVLGGFD
jgi:hypothetical protein